MPKYLFQIPYTEQGTVLIHIVARDEAQAARLLEEHHEEMDFEDHNPMQQEYHVNQYECLGRVP